MASRIKVLQKIIWSLISFLFLFTTAEASTITGPFGSSPWSAIPSNFRYTPSFPDKMSHYEVFNFRPGTGDFDGLKMTGRFPHARYFSFSLYQLGQNEAVYSIVDFEIAPDECRPNIPCPNPFVPGADRSAETGSYTIWVLEEGAPSPVDAKNVLYYPKGIDAITILGRIYRPDIGYDETGGVGLPAIEAVKYNDARAVAPESGFGIIDVRSKASYFITNTEEIEIWDIKKDYSGGEVVFYRTPPGGTFPDQNTDYITASLEQYYYNNVAVITMKRPPTYEDTCQGDAFTGETDVRYWSFCISGIGAMTTLDCLCDDEIQPNEDGSVTLVIAGYALKDDILDAGLNFMRWGLMYKPKLIHRHIMPSSGFEANIKNVPMLDNSILDFDYVNEAYMEAHRAEIHMGDYTPKGYIFPESEFLRRLKAGDFHQAF